MIIKNNIAIRIAGKVSRYIDACCREHMFPEQCTAGTSVYDWLRQQRPATSRPDPVDREGSGGRYGQCQFGTSRSNLEVVV